MAGVLYPPQSTAGAPLDKLSPFIQPCGHSRITNFTTVEYDFLPELSRPAPVSAMAMVLPSIGYHFCCTGVAPIRLTCKFLRCGRNIAPWWFSGSVSTNHTGAAGSNSSCIRKGIRCKTCAKIKPLFHCGNVKYGAAESNWKQDSPCYSANHQCVSVYFSDTNIYYDQLFIYFLVWKTNKQD